MIKGYLILTISFVAYRLRLESAYDIDKRANVRFSYI